MTLEQRIKEWQTEYDNILKTSQYPAVEISLFAGSKVKLLMDALETYHAALVSTSKNSCCETCQEAKLVARQAIEDVEKLLK